MCGQFDLDRLEGHVAVLVDRDGRSLNISVSQLPKGAREGDRLIFDGKTFSRDDKATKAALTEARNLLEKITKQ
ncbi:MAG: DUF3006 domain-containing protein [Eubacteriaceae bacterium]|nr:DUF3006 domain-containing protein [Eubacteriaceae bacterium]